MSQLTQSLTALHESTISLSRASSLDDLTQMAVELGIRKLGFERLGIWLLSPDHSEMWGSFGVDETGALRDERSQRLPLKDRSDLMELVGDRALLKVKRGAVIRDDGGVAVGRGAQIMATLWNGDEAIGLISTENLIRGEALDDRRADLLQLYAAAIGLLISLKRSQVERKRLADILEAAPFLVAITGVNCSTSYLNPCGRRMLGVEEGEAVRLVDFHP